MSLMASLSCCGGAPEQRYSPKEEVVESSSTVMDFKHIPEPQLSELTNYMRQRREHVTIYLTNDDIRAEITRNVTEHIQQVDHYPKGRQFLQDDDDLDKDDKELTGLVPYQNRTAYHACYSKLYRMLQTKALGKP
eukprot:gene14147-20110_t